LKKTNFNNNLTFIEYFFIQNKSKSKLLKSISLTKNSFISFFGYILDNKSIWFPICNNYISIFPNLPFQDSCISQTEDQISQFINNLSGKSNEGKTFNQYIENIFFDEQLRKSHNFACFVATMIKFEYKSFFRDITVQQIKSFFQEHFSIPKDYPKNLHIISCHNLIMELYQMFENRYKFLSARNFYPFLSHEWNELKRHQIELFNDYFKINESDYSN
jgi:hypothetical protein